MRNKPCARLSTTGSGATTYWSSGKGPCRCLPGAGARQDVGGRGQPAGRDGACGKTRTRPAQAAADPAGRLRRGTGRRPRRLGTGRGDEVIDLTRESLREGVARLTDGKGVDVVLDGVGGSVTGEALGSLAVGGTLVSIGYAAGMRAEINVTGLIWKNAHIHGFRFALFTPEQVNAANAACSTWSRRASSTRRWRRSSRWRRPPRRSASSPRAAPSAASCSLCDPARRTRARPCRGDAAPG